MSAVNRKTLMRRLAQLTYADEPLADQAVLPDNLRRVRQPNQREIVADEAIIPSGDRRRQVQTTSGVSGHSPAVRPRAPGVVIPRDILLPWWLQDNTQFIVTEGSLSIPGSSARQILNPSSTRVAIIAAVGLTGGDWYLIPERSSTNGVGFEITSVYNGPIIVHRNEWGTLLTHRWFAHNTDLGAQTVRWLEIRGRR